MPVEMVAPIDLTQQTLPRPTLNGMMRDVDALTYIVWKVPVGATLLLRVVQLMPISIADRLSTNIASILFGVPIDNAWNELVILVTLVSRRAT